MPLVRRAVVAATAASSVDLVAVSTDDDEIAEIARGAGASVVRRPPELSGDAASSESAVLHALAHLEGERGRSWEVVVLMQATSPFTSPADVDSVVSAVFGGADSSLSVVPNHTFLWRHGPDGAIAVNHDPARRLPRQELVPEFRETGALYAMRVESFRDVGTRFAGTVALVPVDPMTAIEIDDDLDLLVARAVAARARAGSRTEDLPVNPAALVLDFDGVLTDDRVLTLQDGTEGVVSSRGDGMGLELLRATLGVRVCVLSKEANPVVSARCAKLGLEVFQGVERKLELLERWMEDNGIDVEDVVFVGNDVNDIDCLRRSGCGVVPADAHPDARAAADLVLTREGGKGAVRELCDLMLSAYGSQRIGET